MTIPSAQYFGNVLSAFGFSGDTYPAPTFSDRCVEPSPDGGAFSYTTGPSKYQISGVVTDGGSPSVNRLMRAFSLAGEMQDEAISASDGTYQLNVRSAGEYIVVAQAQSDEPNRNDVIARVVVTEL